LLKKNQKIKTINLITNKIKYKSKQKKSDLLSAASKHVSL